MKNYMPLFVNGSILRRGGVLAENNNLLVPIKEVYDAISMDISLSEESKKLSSQTAQEI